MGLRQADLARHVEISPSYLNLIEHNRRRIGGKLLVNIARALAVEVSALTQGAEAELLDDLGEAASAHPGVPAELDRVDEFVGRFPGWAGLAVAQHRQALTAERKLAMLADRLTHDPYLAVSLHEVLSKVSAIRSTASILAETADLDEDWRRRFHRNLNDDSATLADRAAALVTYLEGGGDVDLGLITPQEELEAWLEERDFHFAELEAEPHADVAGLVSNAAALRSAAARAMAGAYLSRYLRDARAMPMAPFAEQAAEDGYDPARLAARFGTDLPAVFRRLAALPTGGGAPRIGLVTCDGSGSLTLRKSTERFPLPRFGSACPLWPLYRALSRPVAPVRSVLQHAASDGEAFLCFAIAQATHPLGFDGPEVIEAQMLIVPETLLGTRLADGARERIGSSCRICPLASCPARREPSILSETFDRDGA